MQCPTWNTSIILGPRGRITRGEPCVGGCLATPPPPGGVIRARIFFVYRSIFVTALFVTP